MKALTVTMYIHYEELCEIEAAAKSAGHSRNQELLERIRRGKPAGSDVAKRLDQADSTNA